MEPWLELAGAVAALAAPAAPAVAPRTIRLNMEQVFSLADAAQERGDIRVAEAAYEALAHDPNKQVRAEALFRHAKLLAKAGQLESAATLFRTLLDERPDAIGARLELARALDLMGDKDAAWRELRSAQASGLPSRVARLVDRYSDALRSARPMGASLEITIAPDSNISRSTRSDTLGTVLGDFEIDDDSKAKSGLGLALRGQAYRRFGLGEGSSILVRASGFADLYKKSEFNDIALDVAAGPEFLAGRSRVQLELGATQRWFGQDPYLRSARVKGTWTLPVDGRSQLRIGASATLNDNQQNDLQDGKRFSGEIAFERALSASMGAALSLSADREVALGRWPGRQPRHLRQQDRDVRTDLDQRRRPGAHPVQRGRLLRDRASGRRLGPTRPLQGHRRPDVGQQLLPAARRRDEPRVPGNYEREGSGLHLF